MPQIQSFQDRPKLLAQADAREDRLAGAFAPHVRPLNEYVEALRGHTGLRNAIPYFDPWDGGVNASLLILLEAPGPKAVATGFVSRNNPDETARNLFELARKARLHRENTVLWNIVPWYLGESGRIRPANKSDIEQGCKHLCDVLTRMPELQAVLLAGKKAQAAEARVRAAASEHAIFASPHPSPMFVNRAPGNRGRVLNAFESAARFLDEGRGAR